MRSIFQRDEITYHFDAALRAAFEIRPCCLAEHLVSLQKASVLHSERVTSTAHSNVFQQSQIPHLMAHKFNIEFLLLLARVRLETADIMWLLGLQVVHQICTKLRYSGNICDGNQRKRTCNGNFELRGKGCGSALCASFLLPLLE